MSKRTPGRMGRHDFGDGWVEWSLHFGAECFGAVLRRDGDGPPPIMVMFKVAPKMLDALEGLVEPWDEFNEGDAPGNMSDAYYCFAKGKAFERWRAARMAIVLAKGGDS